MPEVLERAGWRPAKIRTRNERKAPEVTTGRDLTPAQRAICAKYGANFSPIDPMLKVGININLRTGLQPLNGLRHPQAGDTCGWYLWAGEGLTEDPDFFVPLHAVHLADWCPLVLPYLALPPGWRFLIAEGHEDVWFDAALLSVEPNLNPNNVMAHGEADDSGTRSR